MTRIEQINKNIKTFERMISIFNILLICIDNQEINEKLIYTKNLVKELKNNYELYLEQENIILFNKIDNDLFTINNLINELKEDLFNKFKLVSIVYLDNLKDEELIIFYDNLNNILKEHHNIKNACEYIYYHSGKEISEFITKLLNYINKNIPNINNKKIPITYLENNKNIVTIYYKEWIDLFKQLNYTMKYIADETNQDYLLLKQEYQILLVYYFIVITEGQK